MRVIPTLFVMLLTSCWAQTVPAVSMTGTKLTGGSVGGCISNPPLTYCNGVTDQVARPYISFPTEPAKNVIFTDPDFRTRLIRATNTTTCPSCSGGASANFATPGSEETHAWAFDDSSFIFPTLAGELILCDLNTTTFQATCPRSANYGPFALASGTAIRGVPQFGYTSSDSLYAMTNTNPPVFGKVVVSTRAETNQHDPNTANRLNGALNSISLSTPTAPGVAQNTGGGTIAAGTYYVSQSCWTATQETPVGAETTVVVAGAPPHQFVITPSTCTAATGYNVYIGTTQAGSGNTSSNATGYGLRQAHITGTGTTTITAIGSDPVTNPYRNLTCQDVCYGRDVSVDATDTRFSTLFGGNAQDADYFVYIYDTVLGGRWLNTATGQIGNDAGGTWSYVTGAATTNSYYLIHDARMDINGRYVLITPSVYGCIKTSTTKCATRLVWDITTNTVTDCGSPTAQDCSNHPQIAYGNIANTGTTAYQWAIRTVPNLGATQFTYLNDEPPLSWGNNLANNSHTAMSASTSGYAFIGADTYAVNYPTNNLARAPSAAYEDEIIIVQSTGSTGDNVSTTATHGLVHRMAHTWNEFCDTSLCPTNSFNSQGIANFSNTGKYVMYPANWKNPGVDTVSDSTHIDIFIFELK